MRVSAQGADKSSKTVIALIQPFEKAESELVQGTPLKKPTCVRFRSVLPSNHLTDEVIV
jgi:hypothetical protein